MKKEIAEKWVEALRSGEYQQGQHRLRTEDKFCCLGVLCDISGLSEWEEREDSTYISYDSIEVILPDSVMKWAGIATDNDSLHAGTKALSAYNDSGYSFEQIADIIEKHWEEL